MLMDENWVLVFSSTFYSQVDLYKALLEDHDIPAIILNKQDSFYKSIGEVELYVKRDNFLKAKQLISKGNS
jgi:hypothetical protein